MDVEQPHLPWLETIQEGSQKRRRLQEVEDLGPRIRDQPTEAWAATSDLRNQESQDPPKHSRNPDIFSCINRDDDNGQSSLVLDRKVDQEAYLPLLAAPKKKTQTSREGPPTEETSEQDVAGSIGDNKIDPVKHWAEEGSWPEEYLQQDSRTAKDLEQFICLEKFQVKRDISMAHLLAKKKSSDSLNHTNSESGMTTPSDQQPREEKSTPYNHPGYEALLGTKGIYMSESNQGITVAEKEEIQTLLNRENEVPNGSLFSDDQFQATCEKIRNRNEARVTRDISLLIVPSAEILETQGATHLEHLIESVNEGWNNSIRVTKPRPQPDYSVGFRRSAFTKEQLERLEPFVGDFDSTSFYMATWQIYFPFLTCELKGTAGQLEIADRQNAHSMALAVRGIVELFRLVNREKEVNRKILAFSISHECENVRIFGHYAVINGSETTFHRHSIKKFDFTSEEGKEKWTTYKFTKNVYDTWMPAHLKRICSAIDDIPPDLDFGVPPADSFASIAIAESDSEPAPPSQSTSSFKKPRLPPKVMLQQENERLKEKLDQEREQNKQEYERLRQETKEETERLRRETKEESERLRQEIKELTNILKQKLT